MNALVAGVILTLNEESSLARAITSLQWCDAIFVVDSGSTDGTIEVAKAMGAIVMVNKPVGRFLITDQRNWAVSQLADSKFEWILFLDADEESTGEFAASVRSAIDSPDGPSAYYAAPAFMFHGKWIRRTSGYPNYHPRLVRASLADPFCGGVWEEFRPELHRTQLGAPYLHYPNALGAEAWLAKHLRYASWEATGIVRDRKLIGRRRTLLRKIRYGLGPLRKYAYLAYLAFYRGAVLDGPAGWRYLRRIWTYERMIDHIAEDYKREEVQKAL